MSTSFEQHFTELDQLLRDCERDINVRQSKIRKILIAAYCIRGFIPASPEDWVAFYKNKYKPCPENVYACQVYFPKLLAPAQQVSLKPPESGIRQLLSSRELPTKTSACTSKSIATFKSKKLDIDIAENVELNIIQIILALDLGPKEKKTFRKFISDIAKKLSALSTEPGSGSGSVSKIIGTLMVTFGLLSHNMHGLSPSNILLEFCNKLEYPVIDYVPENSENNDFSPKINSYGKSPLPELILRNRSKSFVPSNFCCIVENRYVYIMTGLVLQTPGFPDRSPGVQLRKFKTILFKYSKTALKNLSELQDLNTVLQKGNFQLKGISEISKNTYHKLKFAIYKRAQITLSSDNTVGLNFSGKPSTSTSLDSISPTRSERREVCLSKAGSKLMYNTVCGFYCALNGALQKSLAPFLEVFKTERLLFLNRRDPILRYMLRKKENITVLAPKSEELSELQKIEPESKNKNEIIETPEESKIPVAFTEPQVKILEKAGVPTTDITTIGKALFKALPFAFIIYSWYRIMYPSPAPYIGNIEIAGIISILVNFVSVIYGSFASSKKGFVDRIWDTFVKNYLPESKWSRILIYLGVAGAIAYTIYAKLSLQQIVEFINNFVTAQFSESGVQAAWDGLYNSLFYDAGSQVGSVGTVAAAPGLVGAALGAIVVPIEIEAAAGEPDVIKAAAGTQTWWELFSTYFPFYNIPKLKATSFKGDGKEEGSEAEAEAKYNGETTEKAQNNFKIIVNNYKKKIETAKENFLNALNTKGSNSDGSITTISPNEIVNLYEKYHNAYNWNNKKDKLSAETIQSYLESLKSGIPAKDVFPDLNSGPTPAASTTASTTATTPTTTAQAATAPATETPAPVPPEAPVDPSNTWTGSRTYSEILFDIIFSALPIIIYYNLAEISSIKDFFFWFAIIILLLLATFFVIMRGINSKPLTVQSAITFSTMLINFIVVSVGYYCTNIFTDPKTIFTKLLLRVGKTAGIYYIVKALQEYTVGGKISDIIDGLKKKSLGTRALELAKKAKTEVQSKASMVVPGIASGIYTAGAKTYTAVVGKTPVLIKNTLTLPEKIEAEKRLKITSLPAGSHILVPAPGTPHLHFLKMKNLTDMTFFNKNGDSWADCFFVAFFFNEVLATAFAQSLQQHDFRYGNEIHKREMFIGMKGYESYINIPKSENNQTTKFKQYFKTKIYNAFVTYSLQNKDFVKFIDPIFDAEGPVTDMSIDTLFEYLSRNEVISFKTLNFSRKIFVKNPAPKQNPITFTGFGNYKLKSIIYQYPANKNYNKYKVIMKTEEAAGLLPFDMYKYDDELPFNNVIKVSDSLEKMEALTKELESVPPENVYFIYLSN